MASIGLPKFIGVPNSNESVRFLPIIYSLLDIYFVHSSEDIARSKLAAHINAILKIESQFPGFEINFVKQESKKRFGEIRGTINKILNNLLVAAGESREDFLKYVLERVLKDDLNALDDDFIAEGTQEQNLYYIWSIWNQGPIRETISQQNVERLAPNLTLFFEEFDRESAPGKQIVQHMENWAKSFVEKHIIRIVDLLKNGTARGKAKNQDGSNPEFVIFHGSPGTGKTTEAKAYSKEKGWTSKLIQIHPSYSYEDLVEGIKPITYEDGGLRYEIVEGPIRIEAHRSSPDSKAKILTKITRIEPTKLVCSLPNGTSQRYSFENVVVYPDVPGLFVEIGSVAGDRFEIVLDSKIIDSWFKGVSTGPIFRHLLYRDTKWGQGERVLILDEINRGNIAQMFGELLFAIAEQDSNDEVKRGVDLQYSGQSFLWPKRLHLIGTMNSADTSTDRLDQAIKRRFRMEQCLPNMNLLSQPNDQFGFLANPKLRERLPGLAEKCSIDDLLSECKAVKFSELLKFINTTLSNGAQKKYGIVHVEDKLIGHSYFIRLARLITEALCNSTVDVVETAFWTSVSAFASELAPALQSIMNHDERAMAQFYRDLCGEIALKDYEEFPILSEKFQTGVVRSKVFGGNLPERRKNNVHKLPDRRAA